MEPATTRAQQFGIVFTAVASAAVMAFVFWYLVIKKRIELGGPAKPGLVLELGLVRVGDSSCSHVSESSSSHASESSSSHASESSSSQEEQPTARRARRRRSSEADRSRAKPKSRHRSRGDRYQCPDRSRFLLTVLLYS